MEHQAIESAPLKDGEVFASTCIDEMQEFVGSVFCPHKLNLAKSVKRVDARMHHAKLSKRSSLNFLHYGPAVTVEPGEVQHFFNVQVQLEGKVKTRCGSQIETVLPGEAGILSPSEYSCMEWEKSSSMLIFNVERELVERKLSALLDRAVCDPLVFETKMTPSSGAGAGWLRAIKFLQREFDSKNSFFSYPHSLDSFEENLIVSLLYGHAHNYSQYLCDEAPSVAPGHVKRVEYYILANAAKDISIEDLAKVAQTSVRSLFAGFKQFRGISPMRYLRNVRLDNVRRDLKKVEQGVTVTDVATRWGFSQLGRFAGDYQRRFGELPSATLRAAR